MNDSQQPLVSVITPVHNGGAFLEECIRSVIGQTYANWEYIIVNNASTDSTGDIAAEFSTRDSRIRIVDTPGLLPIMKNWNLSMRQLDSRSVYCKVLHADDYLFPECLATMVETADRYPSAAIVGAYAFWGRTLVSVGLAREEELLPGAEICRRTLKKEIYPFQSPSCLMIRSNLVRNRDPFYRESALHADIQMCYELLREHDFAFAHKILTYVRRHDGSTTSKVAAPLRMILPQNLDLLREFGPEYLDQKEYSRALRRQLHSYQRFLVRNRHRRDDDFWKYHLEQLASLGFPQSRTMLRMRLAIDGASSKLLRRSRL